MVLGILEFVLRCFDSVTIPFAAALIYGFSFAQAQFALKKECERRALEIVHRMLETSVNEAELKDSARLINPDYYNDIVIERGIANLCGYFNSYK